ncbi:MAG: amidohydrolase family protein [Bacteroidetes bacterium]|nr:amidohydrolase family protein [Bacteroidota bacterium]
MTFDESTNKMNRRKFLKKSVSAGSKLLIGAAGISTISNCDSTPEWKGTQFPKVLLHNFKLFDGISSYLQKDLIVLVEGEKIIGIERKSDLGLYNNFKQLDMKGWTLLPGLIDNHVHLTFPFISNKSKSINALMQMNDQFELNFKNCVMSGVTTARDVGGFPEKVLKYKEKSDKNEIPGPRVVCSLSMIAAREDERMGWPSHAQYYEGFIRWIMGGNFVERAQTVDEVNEVCQFLVSQGASWLKTLHHDHSFHYKARKLPVHSDEGYLAILKQGEKHDLRCAIHAMFVNGFKKAVDLGYHTIEHTPMDAIIPDDYVDKFVKSRAALIPTAKIYADLLYLDKQLRILESNGSDYLVPEALESVTDVIKKYIYVLEGNVSLEKRNELLHDPVYVKDLYPYVAKNIAALNSAGAKLGFGTDCGGALKGLFGFCIDEMKYLSAIGISNFDILKMATKTNSEILGLKNDIGTIEKGKLADIIAVAGDPLTNLDVFKKVGLVMKGGTVIKNDGIAL